MAYINNNFAENWENRKLVISNFFQLNKAVVFYNSKK